MRSKFKFALAFIVSALSLQVLVAQVVQTAQGKISGQKEPSSAITAFKGIPYAAPPVGNLRWQAPQPPSSWEGIRKAMEFSASCMQHKDVERLPWTKEFMVQNQISEDCLYLNIWTPKVNPVAGLPVIVFIHGGGFREGSGAIDVYHGGNLAAKGAVVVTINYRLGVFGFLAHPELTAESEHHSSGNYGLMDQIAALEWLKSNIAQFGGDPQNITIWGQSAGAFSVAALIASPLASGLFQRGQADSGLGIKGLTMPNLSDAEQGGLRFAEEHHAAAIKALRDLPAADLVPASQSNNPELTFAPIVDGWVLPDTPNNLNAQGADNDVSVITGYQAGDSMMFSQKVNTLEEYKQMLHERYGEMAAEFEKLYPVSKVDEAQRAIIESGQDRIRVSMFLWASARARSHRQPVFIYYFDRAIPWPQHPEFGAFHSGEIPYFFLNLKALDRPWVKEDFTLANNASDYLLNFASKGEPNGVLWSKVDPREARTIELGMRTGPMPVADTEKVGFWIRYYNSPISNTSTPF